MQIDNGLDIKIRCDEAVSDIYAFKQYRFSKSKKKRIRKKWAKNYGRNWKTVFTKYQVYKIGDLLLVSSKLFKELQAEPNLIRTVMQ